MRLEGGSGQASGALGGEGPLRIEPRPGATGGCTLAGFKEVRVGSQRRPGSGLWPGGEAGGLGLPLDVWGLDLASRGRGPPWLHGAILCFRIRIVNFILNCRTAAGGEDGAGRGRSGATRGC